MNTFSKINLARRGWVGGELVRRNEKRPMEFNSQRTRLSQSTPVRVNQRRVEAGRFSTGGRALGQPEASFLSITAYRKAWETKCSPTQKLVLLALADRADAMGYCWPSIRDISERTGLSKDTVWRTITRLETSGVVFVLRDHRHTNQYSILGVGDPPSPKDAPIPGDSQSLAGDSPSPKLSAQDRRGVIPESPQSSGTIIESSINREANPEVCVDWKLRLEMLKEELGME